MSASRSSTPSYATDYSENSASDLQCRVDVLLATIDALIAAQVALIMRHPRFQQLERLWRGLQYLVANIDFSQNIQLVICNISKDDLLIDFEDTAEVTRSGLYKHAYTAEYGQFGGQPVAAIIADYAFSPENKDIQLLQYVSKVASMAHAPFMAAAHPSFFGIHSWDELPVLNNLKNLFDSPRYKRWHAFRNSQDAQYAVLTLPGFLLRSPYGVHGASSMAFGFSEALTREDDFCWGNPVFILAACLAESFASTRWCLYITGPEAHDSTAEASREKKRAGQPSCSFASTGKLQQKITTRFLVSERKEFELSEEGFMALVLRKGANDLSFYSANTCRKATFGTTGQMLSPDALGTSLSAQLPYVMLISRLAHYLKVIQRENIGSWKDSKTLQQELNKWISQYVTSMDDPDPVTRRLRPLRMAEVYVHDFEENREWYTAVLRVRPHFSYMGANFTLELSSRMEKVV